jgi:DNA-binding phage protein
MPKELFQTKATAAFLKPFETMLCDDVDLGITSWTEIAREARVGRTTLYRGMLFHSNLLRIDRLLEIATAANLQLRLVLQRGKRVMAMGPIATNRTTFIQPLVQWLRDIVDSGRANWSTLAERAGITPSALYQILRNPDLRPRLDTLIALAAANDLELRLDIERVQRQKRKTPVVDLVDFVAPLKEQLRRDIAAKRIDAATLARQGKISTEALESWFMTTKTMPSMHALLAMAAADGLTPVLKIGRQISGRHGSSSPRRRASRLGSAFLALRRVGRKAAGPARSGRLASV